MLTDSPQTLGTTSAVNEQKASLKTRAVDEGKKILIITLYLWVFFAVLSLHKTLVMEQEHLDYLEQGLAIVNALVLAKVMLLAVALNLGSRFGDHPLVYSVLFRSLVFAIVLIGFHILEGAAIDLLRGKPLADSLADFGAGNAKGVFSMGAIAFVALTPFFMVSEMARVLGSDGLRQLFFTRGKKKFTLLVQE
jgi:hypothetical protein